MAPVAEIKKKKDCDYKVEWDFVEISVFKAYKNKTGLWVIVLSSPPAIEPKANL